MKNRGFTLIEIMVVFVVFSIIIGAMFAVLNVGNQSWLQGAAQVEVQQETRGAMDWMIRELRETRCSPVPYPINAGGSGVTFVVPSGTDVNGDIEWDYQIQYSLGGANNDKLIRTFTDFTSVPAKTDTRTIANRVTNLQFTPIATEKLAGPDEIMDTPDDIIRNTTIQIDVNSQKDALSGRTMQAAITSQVTLRNE